MGLLTAGKPLTWEESLAYLQYVKEHGIEQFINIWRQYKDNENDPIKWGDELEYILVRTPTNADDANSIQLSLRSKQIQDDTAEHMSTFTKDGQHSITPDERCIVHPEYGSFMIESTPLEPYSIAGKDLLNVEGNMLYRREWIEASLDDDERLLSLPAFPTMGVGQYCYPYSPPNGPIAQSKFISDSVINPHPRFGTLTQNIRKRKGQTVDIRMPIFRDIHTNEDETEIYMDAMAFGMGCCCLQVTHQASSLKEAKYLNDHLSCLTPILMAVTACTPFLKGKVSDFDCRWKVISQSVDDRTPSELCDNRGGTPCGEATGGCHGNDDDSKDDSLSSIRRNDSNHSRRDSLSGSDDVNIDTHGDVRSDQEKETQKICKSRYGTIDSFLSRSADFKAEYEDIELVKHEKYYQRMIAAGVDSSLAQHIAHLFIRDPLAIYSDIIDVNDSESTYHFETIQSTNWQNVRFKPPPPKVENQHNIGWRVEFRSMEVQITEFENAAFSVFVTLLTRAILFYNLNFYMHISKVDENMCLGHRRDAVNETQFWWRLQAAPTSSTRKNAEIAGESDQIEKMSIKDIICGNNKNHGLISIVKDYINEYEHGTFYSASEKSQLLQYLNFIKRRANGEIMTGAQWLRKYIENHASYNHDSNISEALCRDIVETLDDIVHGKRKAPRLLGDSVDIRKRRNAKIEFNVPKLDKAKAMGNPSTAPPIGTGKSQTEIDLLMTITSTDGKSNVGLTRGDQSGDLLLHVGQNYSSSSNVDELQGSSLVKSYSSVSDDSDYPVNSPSRDCCSRLFAWFR